MSEELELATAGGFVEPRLALEFPGLCLRWTTVPARPGPSPRALRQRLRALSDRCLGSSVVAMRTKPVTHAYRAFFRQAGLDPDASRVPSEQAAVARLLEGGFRSRDLVSDALLVALVETGVPVWALDAERVRAGGLGIRTTRPGEAFGADGRPLPPGTLVVADEQVIHAVLFGEIARGHQVGRRTTRVALFAVGVEGVPAIHLEEALWACGEALGG